MAIDIDYAWEKLYLATLAVASSEPSQRKRLHDAVASNLTTIQADHHLPADIRSQFENFMARMTSDHKEDAGSIQASIDLMDDQQVKTAVLEIINFHEKVSKYLGRREEKES